MQALPWRDAAGNWYSTLGKQLMDTFFFFICTFPLVIGLAISCRCVAWRSLSRFSLAPVGWPCRPCRLRP